MSEPIQFDPPDPSELSKLLDGYEVTSLIATGGMGAVYKATQLSLDRDVAIKLLPKEFGEDPSFRNQFHAEARSMARLNHVNLIGIYDFGEADGMPYIVMELVAGKSLYYSSYGKAIDQATAAGLVIGICRGLSHAHQANIIHRDIKPANILLDPNAKPKIGDFGLAAAGDSEHSEDGPVFGTPGYVAPEIISNPKAIGVQSDIYAVGVILYELLTGKMPEEPASPPSSIAKCDRRFDPIFKKATRRNPALRYQSAQELADDLEKILPNIGTSGQRTVRTGADSKSKAPATTLKRRMTSEKDSDGTDSGKPKLVPLPKGESAPKSRLKPLPKSSPDDQGGKPSAPPAAAAPAAVSVKAGSNWPIIRNLLIIAILIPIIIFTWGLYQDKQAKIKKEREAKELKEKNKELERKAMLEQAKRDEEKKAREAEEKKALEAKREKERQRLLAIENAKTPMERLAEYRTALYNGRRDRFPDNTIDRSSHFLFFVKSPMTWTEASEFAEVHGAHLATPTTQADIDILSNDMSELDLRRVWIGGGAQGKGGWTWVTGEEWKFKDPGTTLGSCASLSNSGVIRARPNAEKNPFVIQWSKDGQNPGSIASQLERLVPTLDSPSPAWPPTTVSHENRHFLLVQKPVSWNEADLIASSADGHLAVFSDPLEGIFLRKFFDSSLLLEQSVWLDGRKKDDVWYWSNGEPWEKASWAPNSPDGGPLDRALRYLKGSAGVGWDDANPKEGNADGFIIEWSTDADGAPAVTNENPNMANGQLAKLRGIGRRLVTKEVEDYDKYLLGNRDYFVSDVNTWFRLLSKNNSLGFEAAYQALEDKLPADGDLSGEIDLSGFPAEVHQDFAKARERQDRKAKELNTKLEALRQSYLKKLLNLRQTFETGGLKTQVGSVDEEIEGVGQDAAGLRAHFGL
jgi:serine/threonine protein kinase